MTAANPAGDDSYQRAYRNLESQIADMHRMPILPGFTSTKPNGPRISPRSSRSR
jgi:hypothetical protein